MRSLLSRSARPKKKTRDKEEKEKTIKLYNTLLNSLSHELRTPIATILGTVDTLKDNKDRLSQPQQLDLLNDIDIAGIRLNRQVENILNMSRLESGMLQPKYDWCDMNELVYNVLQKVTPGAHIIIFKEEEMLPLFKLDIGFMEQILLNLLHNAVHYTPGGSRIEIIVRHESEACLISISDNGNGIPETEIPLLFDKFYRLPHSKSGGSGLGLSIVKGFAEAQNGSVHLSNNLQGGATFTVVIPGETTYLNNLKHE
jgi:Osmosensitive K+ channel histidine kinase